MENNDHKWDNIHIVNKYKSLTRDGDGVSGDLGGVFLRVLRTHRCIPRKGFQGVDRYAQIRVIGVSPPHLMAETER